jgi:Clostripain family/Bacterial pre-peptidase C-terminal domain
MRNRKSLVFFVMFILLFGVLSVSAQDDGRIQYGEMVEGQTIDIDNAVIYTFTGTAGDVVSLYATSDANTDTYLVLADVNGTTLAEHDDVSDEDLSSFIEYTLPASGEYLVGVFGYNAGPFTLLIDRAGSGSTTPVTNTQPAGQTFTGSIDNTTSYVEIPITVETAGSTITIDAQATNGDLDAYLGLFYNGEVVAENDDRQEGDTNPFIEYPNAAAGEYIVAVTRYDFEKGKTTGGYLLSVNIVAAPTSVVNNTNTTNNTTTAADLTGRGYPALDAHPEAEWTVLAYYGGDNNLHDSALADMNEFELGGGSTEKVRVIMLLDGSTEYGNPQTNWTDARIFEVSADVTGDEMKIYPPTIDSQPIANLGEIDSSYGNNLADFLVWGMTNYPAKRYIVALNDHGSGWGGIVTDDTSGPGEILDMNELQMAFRTALQATGVPKFDLLVNDACLMSSIEYYAAMSPYFDFVISSPEVQMTPGFDMTLFTKTLNSKPDISMPDLGKMIVDKYMVDMQALFEPSDYQTLGAAVTDLRQFQPVAEALNNFATVVNTQPRAYAVMLGRARTNTYAYSFFLPEDQYGPPTDIDLGDFMNNVISLSTDAKLTDAAQGVLKAIGAARLYGVSGDQLSRSTSYFNIYFPASQEDSNGAYIDQNPLTGWTDLLINYYRNVSPARIRALPIADQVVVVPLIDPAILPNVTITNIFPAETSIAFPTTISMEVTGRNISYGDFTVDQVQADGTLVRLDKSRIVTTVVEDGVSDSVNLWIPGVDDSDFTWEVSLALVTDGTTSSFELVESSEGVSSIAGRYHYPGSEEWQEVTVIFDDDGNTSRVIAGLDALAPLQPEAGGEFQAYRSMITSDGQVQSQPGTVFQWTEAGIRWQDMPAPSGQYNLGFRVVALGGETGFSSVPITVNNDAQDATLRGYVDDDWGFTFQHPAEWFNVTYFPDSDFLQTSNLDANEYIFVYPVYDMETFDLQAISQSVLDKFDLTVDGGFTPINVAGEEALQFSFSYSNDSGTFASRAFAVYIDSLSLGLVFSAESIDAARTDQLYQLLLDSLTFFDAQAVKDQDRGMWTSDAYTDNDSYPVPNDWMPGAESDGLFWIYRPGNATAGSTVAGVTVLTDLSESAAATLDTILAQEIEGKAGYALVGKDTYYSQNHNWEYAQYTLEGGTITGRLYVTVVEGKPYLLMFEAPTAEFEATFADVFTVMLDGFEVTVPTEA